MNATSIAYAALKNAVLNGDLSPHERLNEALFCEKLAISRTPLRSAVERLTAEGWLRTAPNRAVQVVGVSEQEIVELYAMRGLLEAAAVELAAEKCTDADINQLQYMLAAQKLAADAGNQAEVARLGQQFHQAIWRIAGNHLFLEFLSILQERMTRYRRLSASQPGRTMEATEEHEKILRALRSHNSAAASKHLVRHIAQGKALALAAFRQWQSSGAAQSKVQPEKPRRNARSQQLATAK